ncbi:MAG: acyl-CoA synthetase [Methylobacteriaceae bacterium]|nr:acyl-CoA synthetase [Methylobacteriaceae bacterium]
MLPDIREYDRLIREFRWNIPPRYNIGVDVCDRWADRSPNQAAILEVNAHGDVKPATYGELRERSNRLANALAARGVTRGDRVAVLLSQMHQTAVAHIAIYKMGAIAVPLAALFGVDALEYRLRDAGVKALVTNAAGATKVAGIRDDLPDLQCMFCTDGAASGAENYDDALATAAAHFTPADTSPDDPGLMIYTSGTTGPAKGALHGHRVVLGHLPGVEFPHEFLPQPGDRFWTPADWAWAGGLLNSLLPCLHFGIPIVARSFEKFDPDAAFALMADLNVRNTFIPPTALRMLRAVDNPRGRFNLNLRTLASGGESLGAETYAWGREQLGLTINEFYGQTECNLVLGSCAAIGIGKPGAIGRAIPGHNVAVIRDDGTLCETDELGQIAVKRPDPVMFLQYWNKPEATREKFIGDWMTTGDQGMVDDDGYVRFVGRDDDVITSAGYRIGPGEIEDCLIRHPAVAIAAAIGKPDPVRTEIVKAFIVLRPGHAPSDALAADIQHFVRTRLAAHEYPREVAFVESLPLTTTGKVIRRELRERA